MTSRVPVPGGDVCSAFRVERADGPVFVEAEARGLAWLRVDGGPPLPEVLEVTSSSLTLSWVASSASSVGAARAFGAALARMHASGPPAFGAAGTPRRSRWTPSRPTTGPPSSPRRGWGRSCGWPWTPVT